MDWVLVVFIVSVLVIVFGLGAPLWSLAYREWLEKHRPEKYERILVEEAKDSLREQEARRKKYEKYDRAEAIARIELEKENNA